MTFVLDAGALVAIERSDRRLWTLVREARLSGDPATTHGGVVGQVWRGGAHRQAVLARALSGVAIEPLDDDLGRRAGILMGRCGSRDVVDAALVLLARDGDVILTSDVGDIAALAGEAGLHIDVTRV